MKFPVDRTLSVFRYALFVTLAIGCRSQLSTQSQTSSAADHPIKVFIAEQTGDQYIFFSAPVAVSTLRLCLGATSSVCDVATPGAAVAIPVKTANSTRSFFRTAEKQSIVADLKLAISYVSPSEPNPKPRYVRFIAPVSTPTPGDTSGGSVVQGLNLISRTELETNLKYLASREFNGRDTGTPENEKAAQWLIGKLREYNIAPLQGQDYLQKFTARQRLPSPRQTANILAVIPGSDAQLKDRYIVLGAHMDHVGTRACNGGGMCAGADDNGSGTVSVLNIAKALSAARGNLKRSVIIMFFTGEELGLLGSYHYVRNPVVSLDKIDYMINMDMVGYLRGGKLSAGGALRNQQAAGLLQETLKKYPDVKAQLTEKYSADSDHAPFFEAGVAGMFFHTGLHDNYHRAGDTPEETKINYDGMTSVAKISYEHVVDVANMDKIANVGFSLANYATEPLHGHVHGDGEFSGCAQPL